MDYTEYPADQSREKRLELIKAIEEKRSSRLICYITSDRQGASGIIEEDVIPIIHDHVASLGSNKNIDIFIYSRGGSSDVPWTIVSMLREYAKNSKLGIIIPFRAHSAATVIALGCDEIVMTRKAELGPIDTTIGSGPYNPRDPVSGNPLPVSVEDVRGYFSLWETSDCGSSEDKVRMFQSLSNQVHPLILGNVNRVLEQTKLVAKRLLDTRHEKYGEKEKEEIVRKLSSEIYSHRHAINRSEAVNYMGLKNVVKAEEIELDEAVWSLYKQYEKFFMLREPFDPNGTLAYSDELAHTWKNVPLACVESVDYFDVYRHAIRIAKIYNITPSISLNLNLKMDSPHIQIEGSMADKDLLDKVKSSIQQIIESAISASQKKAMADIIKSAGIKGFQTSYLNGNWYREG